ncbi:unnamed protein product [Spodoptera exigua]|nr:unnamed protein product [Spodoptera exigua]
MLVTLSKMLSFLWRIRRPMLVVLLIMCVSPIIFISMDQAKDMIQDISVTSRHPNVSVHWRGVKTGFRNITLTPDSNKNEPYNVVILCLESVSHNGFIRNMKKSYKYLKEKMNATILNGYNIANDGTTGALYPLFTGKSENDLKEMNEFGMRRDNPSYFIFNQLKPLGYRTAYFDDTGLIATPYQFRFTYPPADHYLRPYSLARRNGKPHRSLSHHCIESAPQYQMLMHFVKECLLLDGKKFIFSLIDDLSSENFTFVPSADDSLLDFLQTMTARRVLEDTLLIVMGDHGPRFSPIRSTHQGMLEERLPLMAIILPHKLIKARPLALKALVNNKDVLTTPLDIFTTILDVLGVDEVEPPDKLDGFDLPRAMSLLGPIVMDPGHAIYEGTMIYIPSKDFFMVAERDISRVNAYGDESSCISDTHPHLNKYCYCNKSVNIKKNKSKPKIDLFRIGL